jgi:hypothetical protein
MHGVTAPSEPSPNRRYALRIAGAVALPVLVLLWTLIPALQPKSITIAGNVKPAEACLIACAPVIEIGDKKIACKTDLLGVSYDCRKRLTEPGAATITYSPIPSLARLTGLAPTDGVLLRIEKNGERLYSRSFSSQVWAGLYEGWVFHAFYWPLMGIAIWLWPNSWLSRRVTWSDYQRDKDQHDKDQRDKEKID